MKSTIIQLQRLNEQTQANEGGLYINTDYISEIVPITQKKGSDQRVSWTRINMSNGNTWLTPFSVSSILDMLTE